VHHDAAALVAAHPAGTTFVFEGGVHRLSAVIVPRDGDTFVGEDGAVLNGSRLLTSFGREGGLWIVSGQTQQGSRHGSCTTEAPRCSYPEDLFIDDVPLRHVASLGDVVSGAWFFDYEADKIYFADDPTGRKVETSVTNAAFRSDASDVTIRGLVIEKFANQAQRGVIQSNIPAPRSFGERWLIEDNTVRLNHGTGIRANHGSRVLNNRVLMNGQLGIGGGQGPGTVIEGNEIAYNNWAGFSWGWEGGGTKFVQSDGLVIRDNHVHNNGGPGLWADVNNINTLYEYNLVEHNRNNGIFHEISYRATIRYNTSRYNGVEVGLTRYGSVWGAGILVYSSPDVEVYGNIVYGNWNGITALHHDRGTGTYGPHELRNLYVHGNDITMTYHEQGVGPKGEPNGWPAMTGVFQAGGFTELVYEQGNNRFENNTYRLPATNAKHFQWHNSLRAFDAWQGYGHDAAARREQPPLVAR
jgi:hypothetical protein